MLMLTLSPTPSNRWTMFAFACIHFVGCAAALCLLGLFIVPSLIGPLVKEMKDALAVGPSGNVNYSSSAEQIKIVVKKFEFLLAELRRQSFLNILLALMFGTWPYLQQMSSYFLPLAWMFCLPMMIMALYSNVPVRGTKSSPSSDHVSSLKPPVSSVEVSQSRSSLFVAPSST